jgi:hypothetical protein
MEDSIQVDATPDSSEQFSVMPIDIFSNKHLNTISVDYRRVIKGTSQNFKIGTSFQQNNNVETE